MSEKEENESQKEEKEKDKHESKEDKNEDVPMKELKIEAEDADQKSDQKSQSAEAEKKIKLENQDDQKEEEPVNQGSDSLLQSLESPNHNRNHGSQRSNKKPDTPAAEEGTGKASSNKRGGGAGRSTPNAKK
jgi:hypothetical protein